MSFNLLDVVKGHLNSDVISKAASFLGESEGGVSKAMGGILPTLLSGLASKAGSSDGANEVASMASTAHNSGVLGNIAGFFGGGDMLSKGVDLVKGLFGAKSGGIIDTISSFAGLKSGTAGSLMGMALPVILGSLGKHSSDNNLGAGGIASLLSSGKSSWANLLPSGLGNLLGGLGGSAASAVSSITGGAKDVAGSVTNYSDDAVEGAKGGMKWLLPLLLLGALGFLGYWLTKDGGCGKKEGASTTTGTGDASTATTGAGAATVAVPKVTVDSLTGVVNYELGATGDVELPGGVKLVGVAKDGFENTLLNFIKTGTIDTVNKKANWFNMHDVQFVSGKTTYATPKAMAQIKNVAAILKAYPKVAIKLGGNTDVTGDATANKTLSQNRANQVMKDIIASGAAAAQLKEAVGYGSEFAEEKGGNKEGMARDRKTTAKVAAM
jgi:outer membrane protein OmpA-like peptidoglycan-associated protein